MYSILIVDDSQTSRQFITRCLADLPDTTTEVVRTAEEAILHLESHSADLVVTDLVMPGMSGLDLTKALRSRYPALPVILTTSQGSESMATAALQAGAVNYLAKRDVARNLRDVCDEVLSLCRDKHQRIAVFGCNKSGQLQFEIPSDPAMACELARHLQEITSTVMQRDDTAATQIGVALTEALLNAVIHGNLGISSELKERDDDSFRQAIARRRQEAPYADRCVHVNYYWNESVTSCVIRDEGQGFDVHSLPDPDDPSMMLKASGRGIILMRSFMDFVGYNRKGNEVTLTKHFVHPDPFTSSAPALAGAGHTAM